MYTGSQCASHCLSVFSSLLWYEFHQLEFETVSTLCVVKFVNFEIKIQNLSRKDIKPISSNIKILTIVCFYVKHSAFLVVCIRLEKTTLLIRKYSENSNWEQREKCTFLVPPIFLEFKQSLRRHNKFSSVQNVIYVEQLKMSPVLFVTMWQTWMDVRKWDSFTEERPARNVLLKSFPVRIY